MKKIIFLSVFINLCIGVNSFATEREFLEIKQLSLSLKNAILNEDTQIILTHVAPSGTYFMDTNYTYEEITGFLNDRKSWLYKYLFTGKDSIKYYFENAKNLEIKIFKRDTGAYFVSYRSSNFTPQEWKENCFVKENSKYFFDGIFFCE